MPVRIRQEGQALLPPVTVLALRRAKPALGMASPLLTFGLATVSRSFVIGPDAVGYRFRYRFRRNRR